MWQNRTTKKHIAALSGAFNDWITVCINSETAIGTDSALKNAGAHFKYERLKPFSGGDQKQVCYVKLIDNPQKKGYLARYQCTGLFGSHADTHFQSLDLKPCNVYFNKNEKLREQFEKIEERAKKSER